MIFGSQNSHSYWLRVHLEALHQARDNLALAVIRLLLAVPAIGGGLWAAFAGASEVQLTELGLVRIIAAISSVLLLLGLYFHAVGPIPAIWDHKKDQLIDEMAKNRGPWITLSATLDSICVVGETIKIGVGVFNPSDITVCDVFVELDWFVQGTPVLNLPRKLKPRNTTSPTFDLLPRQGKYVDVGSVKAGSPSDILLQFVDQQDSDAIGPGSYSIRLKVYGHGVLPVSRCFTLEMSPDGDFLRFDEQVININNKPEGTARVEVLSKSH